MITSFYDSNVCDFYWIHKYVRGIDTPPSDVMLRGLLFEYEVIGGCRAGQRPELPKSKAKGKLFGTPLKEERDLIELANQSKELIKTLGYELLEVQPEWHHEDVEGHPDAIAIVEGRKAIVDVKYTETTEHDWRNGWGDLDSKSTIQPIHYTWLSKKVLGEYMPFYYWIFGKSGWVKLIKENVMPSAIEEHDFQLNRFREQLNEFKPVSPNNYNKCRTCPYWDICDHKTTIPEIQQHEITELIIIA